MITATCDKCGKVAPTCGSPCCYDTGAIFQISFYDSSCETQSQQIVRRDLCKVCFKEIRDMLTNYNLTV